MPGLKGSLGTTDTSGNDTIRGVVDLAAGGDQTTFTALDEIDGGAGRDTLKLAVNDDATAGDINLSNVKNVEVIEISGNGDVVVDSSAAEGAEELKVVKVGATKIVDATAADTTDITVEMKAAGATVVTDGGKDVTVKLTDVAGAADVVTVGAKIATGAAGDVVVEMTGAKATANATLSAVNVNGGKTISVTQNATSDDSAAKKDASVTTTITQGAITIAADTATTDITVKQDADVTASAASTTTTGGSAATQTVKFAALKATDSITLAGLTFTANKNLTAEEVAQAFANLVQGTAATLLTTTPVPGDTQSAGSAVNGVYKGDTNGWTSAAAQGDTVVFTQVPSGAPWAITNPGTSTAPTVTATAAVAGTTTPNEDGVLGVVAGVVGITGDTALKNVAVDGYNAAGNTIAGAANTALSEISLSNGGAMSIGSAATSLDLSLENVSGAIAFTAAPETLNIQSNGDNNIGTLTAAATKSLNVSGTGALFADTGATLTATESIKVTESAGLVLAAAADLTNLTSVDTTGTTGTVSMTIDTEKVTYAGGAGSDLVEVAAGKKVEKAIDLGAGDDTFDMSAIAVWSATQIKDGIVVDGGEGFDILALNSAFANGATAAFKDQHKNFEQLQLNVAADATVNLANIGLNNYVTSNFTAVADLTLQNMANEGNLALSGSNAAKTTKVELEDATGSSDVLNVTTYVSKADVNFGTLQADGVETINLSAIDTELVTPDVSGSVIQTATLDVKSDAVTSITVDGNSNLVLTLDAATTELATVDASALEGDLTLDLSPAGLGLTNAVTVTGGAGDDVLTASADKKDIINGGAGNDTIVAGGNRAQLTGGEGDDLFILNGSIGGNLQANTYSTITDFGVGNDMLLLLDSTGAAVKVFNALQADLDESTAVFSDYAEKAINEAKEKEAVYFNFNGDAYIVLANKGDNVDLFTDGTDSIIKLTGIDGNDLSFNADHGTVALI